MALQKIRECIRDCQRPVSSQSELNVLAAEADDRDITGYGDVIGGNELSESERKRLTGDFLIDVRKMSESGDTIIAMAVALEWGDQGMAEASDRSNRLKPRPMRSF